MENANRGKQFENIIKNTLKTFGGHTIVKTDPPVHRIGGKDAKGRFTAVHGAAGQCDFEGGYMGFAVCLEAKDCTTGLFLKDRIRTGQWDRLYATWAMGGISGLLLRFVGDTADTDMVWLVEFGAVRHLFEKRSRFDMEALTVGNAHALAYGAFEGRTVYLPGLDRTLASVAHRLSSDRLRG